VTDVIYIDAGYYDYDFKLDKHCADVIRIKEGIDGKVTFICNSAAKFSVGDVYQIAFNHPQDEGDMLFFKLKYPHLQIIDREKAVAYISKSTHLQLNTL
jgi:hypothetical protein